MQENHAENVQQLYTEKPYEKIKRRTADQVQKLIQKMDDYIESKELRTLVVCIKEKRAKYRMKGERPSDILLNKGKLTCISNPPSYMYSYS